MINGITLNNLTFSSISFQPSISTVQEFKVDNSTFSAEYGQSSGAIVNIATRSGGNEFHGELFEFLRNDALDARNFFELHVQQAAAFQTQPVRRQSRRPDRQEQNFLLLLLRGPAPAAGARPQQSRPQRCRARVRDRPGDREVDRADPASELRRLIRHAALHRLGDRAG